MARYVIKYSSQFRKQLPVPTQTSFRLWTTYLHPYNTGKAAV